MRWPWQARPEPPPERRVAATDYSTLVSRMIAAQAGGQTVHATRTAAVEAAAGALSRAFAAATVEGPEWTREAVTPRILGQIGRDLVRVGETLHALRMDGKGRIRLIPCSTWYFEGEADPDGWTCTATAYGPSGSSTWRLPWASVVFASWGSPTTRPYHGLPPTGWASDTARLSAAAERTLADEAAGPLAQLIAIPQDGGDSGEDDPLAMLKSDIAAAKGKALLLETTAAGWDQGRVGAPQRDWSASRLGPNPPAGLVEARRDAFLAVLAACGTPPDLFAPADGTAQREALRRWHMGTVVPLARMLEHELSAKLDAPIRLRFDGYPLDLQARAATFQKLVAGGVAVTEALATSGLLAGEDA